MAWRVLTRYLLRRGIALLAMTLACCPPSSSAENSAAAAVSPHVVPEDRYPERHVDFQSGVVGFPDLVYATLPGFRPLHLDLYRPRGKPGSPAHPFVVYLHGGGWQSGHTRQSGAFASWPDVLASLAARGYVVASVEYRLSGEARFPAAQQDVKAAIRWLRGHAARYGLDRSRGLVWGASAGGQLAALTATSCGVATLEPEGPPVWAGEPGGRPPPATSNSEGAAESDCVQGAVTWYGIFDFSTLAEQRDPGSTALPDRADSADARYLGCRISSCPPEIVSAASPVNYIDRDDPPMLLVHGLADKTVPVKQSQEMYDKLRAAGVPVQLFLVPDVDHSFIGKTPADTREASRAALSRVFEFIDATIGARANVAAVHPRSNDARLTLGGR
jgi:acetyl esterase/lipase